MAPNRARKGRKGDAGVNKLKQINIGQIRECRVKLWRITMPAQNIYRDTVVQGLYPVVRLKRIKVNVTGAEPKATTQQQSVENGTVGQLRTLRFQCASRRILQAKRCPAKTKIVTPEPVQSNSPKSATKLGNAVAKSPRNFAHEPDAIEHILLKSESLQLDTNDNIEKSENKKETVYAHIPPIDSFNNNCTYDFLPQSASKSGMQIDPAADVIKRLINEGKAVVATKRKGARKPVIKRMQRKPIKRQKIDKATKASKTDEGLEKQCHSSPNREIEQAVVSKAVLTSLPHQNSFTGEIIQKPESIQSKLNNSSEGTFSRLARSVLKNEAARTNIHMKKVQEQRSLLAMARNFVSTPINKKYAPLIDTTTLSPIGRGDTTSQNTTQPWRVSINAPSTFQFSRNSANLPSYSSEHIPSTPRKPKSANCIGGSKEKEYLIDTTDTLAEMNTVELSSVQHDTEINLIPAGTENDSLPTANKSNKENESPPEAPAVDVRQYERLQHPLRKRSPLKALNIINVLTLPNWRNAKCPEQEENDGNTKSEYQDSFGFEEFVDSEESEDDEAAIPSVDEKTNLHLKLRNLKKLRPGAGELLKSASTTSAKEIFDTRKERRIDEMLCSTLINPRAIIEKKSPPTKTGCNDGPGKASNEDQLFKDIEPNTTFDEKKSRRTYVRPFKKKRKLRQNFVMFLDSDESGEELAGDDALEDNQNHKRPRKGVSKESKPDPELNNFVKEFNNMWNEVDQCSDLIVEKS